MRAIIGPNGAGKTTMMDIITGKTRPDEGEVLFDGVTDLTRLDETRDRRARHRPQIPEADGVREPDHRGQSAAGAQVDHRVKGTLFWRETKAEAERIDAMLETIRLTDARNRLAGSLSHGQKQWLEIGMLLAQDPKLLLVDEPVAGMTDVETAADRRAAARRSTSEQSVMVVEHDMNFVRELGVKVTCLHEGTRAGRRHHRSGHRPNERVDRSVSGAAERMLEASTNIRPLLRRGAGAARRLDRGRAGQGHLRARPQRRRQDHAAARDGRPAADRAAARSRCDGTGHHRPAALRAGARAASATCRRAARSFRC